MRAPDAEVPEWAPCHPTVSPALHVLPHCYLSITSSPRQAVLMRSPMLPNDAHIQEASRRSAHPHELCVVHLPPPWVPLCGHPASGYLWQCRHWWVLHLGSPPLHALTTGTITAPPTCRHRFPQPSTHITIKDDPSELLLTLNPPNRFTTKPRRSSPPHRPAPALQLTGFGRRCRQLPWVGETPLFRLLGH
jgi:hypothetical protein